MAKLILEVSMSLDGFIAGPNQTLERPLGEGGDRLHERLFGLKSFRERHNQARPSGPTAFSRSSPSSAIGLRLNRGQVLQSSIRDCLPSWMRDCKT
jgi:hypothetical protein